MSIINDALKKAQNNRQLFQNKSSQFLNKVDEIKTDAERFILKRWLIWTWTTVMCLLGIILAVNSFKKPAVFHSAEELTLAPAEELTLAPAEELTLTPAEELTLAPQELILNTKVQKETEILPSVFPAKETEIADIPEKAPVFNLKGILYDNRRPLAIINNRIVGKGALINGAQILDIQPDYVKLSLKEEEFTLEIK